MSIAIPHAHSEYNHNHTRNSESVITSTPTPTKTGTQNRKAQFIFTNNQENSRNSTALPPRPHPEMPPKHVVFDVVGTCVSFTAYYSKINATIGPKLNKYNINAQAFGYAWMTAAELEFTFLSISSRYKPYKTIFAALFYRTLHMMGVPLPAQKTEFTDEERDECIRGYAELELRDGLEECFATLRSAGFTVWCLTTGDIARVRGYFTRGGVDMPIENFITCDSTGVAKPALASYSPALERFGEGEERWFAAAHMWDVSAAVKAGFRGAYCTVYEEYACEEVFDEEMEVVEGSLAEMAKGIVRKTVGWVGGGWRSVEEGGRVRSPG